MPDQLKICFLDSFTLSPADLDLSSLNELGKVQLCDRTNPTDIIARAKDAQVLITNKCTITSDIISRLPNLKLIQVAATGYNNIDLEAAKNYGITVCNVSGYSTESVGQHVFAMLLSYINQVHVYNKESKNGYWSDELDFSYWHNAIPALNEMTFGIIGYGKIGKGVARIASAFDMKVIVSHKYEATSDDENISFHNQDHVFEYSDVLSLHAPLNASTDKFINTSNIRKMRSNAIIINTGRGGLINENDLSKALFSRKIKAALLDVLSTEPPPKDNVLLKTPNCFITPHQAWANQNARKKLLNGIINNISNFLSDSPTNVVS